MDEMSTVAVTKDTATTTGRNFNDGCYSETFIIYVMRKSKWCGDQQW